MVPYLSQMDGGAGAGGPAERPRVSRFNPFLPRRSRAGRVPERRAAAATSSGVTFWFRVGFTVVGLGLAALGAALLPRANGAACAAFFVLALFFQLFWLESAMPFALPHSSTMIAFGYIAGLAIIPLEYVMRLISLPAMVWLSRRGLFEIPRSLRELIGDPAERNPDRLAAWINRGAMTALGAVSLAARVALFHVFARVMPASGPILRILLCEAWVLGVLGLVHPHLPLPTSEELRRRGPFRWRLDDERIDLSLFAMFVTPMLVVLINMGYTLGGTPGAVIAALASLGPHYVAKLLHDRLSDVALLLEAKQAELKDLVSTIAHDLKAPVSAVLLTADAALDRDGARLPAETREDLDRIQRLAARTEDMVRDMSRLFQIVWAREDPEAVDLGALVASTLDSFRPALAARGATIEIGALPTIFGQRTKLEHVLANLLANAVCHLPGSGGRIELTATVATGTATLCVADNGRGIPLEWQGRIFDLFVRVPGEASNDPGGSGVGLAIVRRIVAAHGGEVWVESAPNAGSRFFVRLPVAPAAP